MHTEQSVAMAAPKDTMPEETKPLRVSINDIEEGWTDTQYKGRPFTGIAVETDRDGCLVAETEYRNGFQAGRERTWHGTGRMASERHFSVLGLDGPAREWYPDGRLRSEALHEHGILLWEKKWDEHGTLTRDWRLTEADPDWARLQRRQEAADVTADRASAAPAA